MAKNTKMIIIGAIVLVTLAAVAYVYFIAPGDKSAEKPHSAETFVTTGGMQNLGSVNYDLVPEQQLQQLQDSHDYLSAPNFADLVEAGNEQPSQALPGEGQRPLERLQALTDSYMPRMASKALPFAQAAAKPLIASYSVNQPRPNLKGFLYQMDLASAVRGPVPINYNPNVAVIANSKFGPSDADNPGLFTTAFDSLYTKLSGSYRNMPIYTAGAGQAGGYGGASASIIMDM